MRKKSAVTALAGAALMTAASIATPTNASALRVSAGGATCYINVYRPSSIEVLARELSCDRVQARMSRYYAGSVYTVYGADSSSGSSLVRASDGYYSSGAGRVRLGAAYSSWISA